jgi:hypothetical protein
MALYTPRGRGVAALGVGVQVEHRCREMPVATTAVRGAHLSPRCASLPTTGHQYFGAV